MAEFNGEVRDKQGEFDKMVYITDENLLNLLEG